MRKQFGQALRIGVSNHGMALLKTSRWRGERVTVISEHIFMSGEEQGAQAIALGLRNLLGDAGCSGWPVTFVLADDMVRLWQVTPPQASARLADLEAAAALRFQSLFGENAAAWKVSASWDARRPFLAAAVRRELSAVLEQAAAESGMRIVEVVPQFVAGWNHWRGAVKSGAWYGQVHERVLTIAAPEGKTLGPVRTAALPQGADQQWMQETVAREALRLNLPAPDCLQLCGQVPAAWNNSSGAGMACMVLGGGQRAGWSNAVALAATGSRV
jgi:hypothetical protein